MALYTTASIRPRLLARGDAGWCYGRDIAKYASIRPRLLARGDDSKEYAEMRRATASIRPRLLARGDEQSARYYACDVPLQFGHACLRVETRLIRPVADYAAGLQFGHACLRVETRLQRRIIAEIMLASIRPRLLARGDPPPVSSRLRP